MKLSIPETSYFLKNHKNKWIHILSSLFGSFVFYLLIMLMYILLVKYFLHVYNVTGMSLGSNYLTLGGG